MTSEVSSTRLYLGNLARTATKADVEAHFSSHPGEITEIKLMNGFGFIEYKDQMDARDVVPAFHGTMLLGERLVVQFARGPRRTDDGANTERAPPRPRRTPHRMQISGLPVDTSWQDLKDFARAPGLDVVYSEISRDREGGKGLVEFETATDMNAAVTKLNNTEFKGQTVRCTADPQAERQRERFRSRSPTSRSRGYYSTTTGYYDDPRRREYSPPPREYRRRSPLPREYYERERGYGPSSGGSMRGAPVDDRTSYRIVPRYPEEGYVHTGRNPRYDEPYMNGYTTSSYGRPPSPGIRRGPSPSHSGYPAEYERRHRWA